MVRVEISQKRLKAREGQGREGRTERDVVANQAQFAEMEACILDGLTLVQQAHGDGHGVRGCQANDTHAGEGVERSAGAKVDQTQGDLYNHGQHHGIW